MKANEMFYQSVKKIVEQILVDKNVLRGDIHYGEVDEVISSSKLKVKLDGSDTPQKIPCNPDITFNIGDQVVVQFFNKNPKDKFVICRREVS